MLGVGKEMFRYPESIGMTFALEVWGRGGELGMGNRLDHVPEKTPKDPT